MSKKKITIDDLARMVKEGFDEISGVVARKDALEAFQRWTMRRFDLIETDLKIISRSSSTAWCSGMNLRS